MFHTTLTLFVILPVKHMTELQKHLQFRLIGGGLPREQRAADICENTHPCAAARGGTGKEHSTSS